MVLVIELKVLIKVFALVMAYLLISMPGAFAFGIGGFDIVGSQIEVLEVPAKESRVVEYSNGFTGCIPLTGSECNDGVGGLCDPGSDGILGTADDYCESWENCCYECGCPGGMYCDVVNLPQNLWECRDVPTSNNIIIEDQAPSSFPEYSQSGNIVTFDYTLTNYPKEDGANLGTESFGFECVSDDLPCTVDYEFLGCETINENPGTSIEKENCRLNITIASHTRDYSYIITPTMGLVLSLFLPISTSYTISKELSPITFNSFVCGDGEVAGDETQETCCYDTGCDGGYYCGTEQFPEKSCHLISDITLELISDPEPVGPYDLCSRERSFPVTVKLNNPPADMEIEDIHYVLGTGDENSIGCFVVLNNEPEFNEYSCEIIIPQQEDTCSGDASDIINNVLYFDINFSHNTSEGGYSVLEEQLFASLPNIQVDVFDPNNDICERDLGEDSSNSCRDCGCVDEGFGSDYFCGGAGENFECRERNFILTAGGFDQTNFLDYDVTTGLRVGFNYNISNFPSQVGAVATNEACSLECSLTNPSAGTVLGDCGGSEALECEIIEGSCSEGVMEDGVLRKENCRAIIKVNSYTNDPTLLYTINPILSVDVVFSDLYVNTAGEETRTIEDEMQQISIGLNYCGNERRDPWEDYENCCFDVPCPGMQICDSELNTGPTGGDHCRDLSSVRLVVDDVDPNVFDSNNQVNTVRLDAHIANAPRRTDSLYFQYLLDFELIKCSFKDKEGRRHECENLGFVIKDCEDKTSIEDLNNNINRFSCDIEIPAMTDFRSSNFYYEDEGKLKFKKGEFSIQEIRYYNSTEPGDVSRVDDIPEDIEIIADIECGDGFCDGFAEIEGERICPEDCGCYLDREMLVNGVCIPLSDITLAITEIIGSVKRESGIAYCVINTEGEDCDPAGELIVTVQVNNAPENLIINVGEGFKDNAEAKIDHDDELEIGHQCQIQDPELYIYECRVAQLKYDNRFDGEPLDQVLIKTLEMTIIAGYYTRDIETHREMFRHRELTNTEDFQYVEIEREDITVNRNCREQGAQMQLRIGEMQNKRDGQDALIWLLTIGGVLIAWQTGGWQQIGMILPMLLGPLQESLAEYENQLGILSASYSCICNAETIAEQEQCQAMYQSSAMTISALSEGTNFLFDNLGLATSLF